MRQSRYFSIGRLKVSFATSKLSDKGWDGVQYHSPTLRLLYPRFAHHTQAVGSLITRTWGLALWDRVFCVNWCWAPSSSK